MGHPSYLLTLVHVTSFPKLTSVTVNLFPNRQVMSYGLLKLSWWLKINTKSVSSPELLSVIHGVCMCVEGEGGMGLYQFPYLCA